MALPILSAFGLGGGYQKQNINDKTSSGVDAYTQQQLKGIQDAYRQAGAAGPSPLLTEAGQFGTAAQGAGQVGLGALGGDPAAVARLMNPYQQNVIDANAAEWQRINQQTGNQVNDAATRAGAFGGSRHGVAQGVALANNNAQQAAQTASLLRGGYQDAMQQASAAANFGQQGAQLNANLGFGGVGSPSQWYAQMLKNGFIMPTGEFTDRQAHNSGWGVNGGIGGGK